MSPCHTLKIKCLLDNCQIENVTALEQLYTRHPQMEKLKQNGETPALPMSYMSLCLSGVKTSSLTSSYKLVSQLLVPISCHHSHFLITRIWNKQRVSNISQKITGLWYSSDWKSLLPANLSECWIEELKTLMLTLQMLFLVLNGLQCLEKNTSPSGEKNKITYTL